MRLSKFMICWEEQLYFFFINNNGVVIAPVDNFDMYPDLSLKGIEKSSTKTKVRGKSFSDCASDFFNLFQGLLPADSSYFNFKTYLCTVHKHILVFLAIFWVSFCLFGNTSTLTLFGKSLIIFKKVMNLKEFYLTDIHLEIKANIKQKANNAHDSKFKNLISSTKNGIINFTDYI